MIAIGETTGKGRGVFAWTHIAAGTQIEEAPVVAVPATQVEDLDRTVLGDYYFLWGADGKEAAILLGTCSLCNHSYRPNAVFVRNFELMTITFFALHDIAPGEEITANYNGDPDSQSPIWFPPEP